MAEEKMMRLSQVARKLNVGTATIADHLASKGQEIKNNPNSKITMEQFDLLKKEFASSVEDKKEASGLTIGKKHNDNVVIHSEDQGKKKQEEEEEIFIKNVSPVSGEKKEDSEEEESEEKDKKEEKEAPADTSKVKLQGIKVVGKIDLEEKKNKEEARRKEEEQKKKEEEESKKKKEEEESRKKKEEEESKKKREEEKKKKEEEESKKRKEEEESKKKKEEEEKAQNQAQKEEEEKKKEEESSEEVERVGGKAKSLKGLTVVGKIDLPKEKQKKKPVASSDKDKAEKQRKGKRKRKRMRIPKKQEGRQRDRQSKQPTKEEVSEKEIQDKIKATLAKIGGGGGKSGGKRSKYRREKRSQIAEAEEERLQREEQEENTLKVTEYISANDLASLMDVSVNDVISTCMSLGMFVSINQRLDAEAITFITDEFGYNVEFTDSEEEEIVEEEEEDNPEDLEERAPVVTIMGHVDHGKTSLLDFIRDTKVASKEAGGITQHIGAYSVETESGKEITFLDTPGHEAFTAMRARGAKVTDIVIIVVAADDAVMPQTKEAINHAQVAGVPIVIAINKVDKPQANPDKIRQELAELNVLVEDWGGKYQVEEISAKTGSGVDDLLEKVLLESEILELQANPNKPAVGTVVEASLDKGRGYLSTVLVQGGTLRVGDIVVSGPYYGKVKAMTSDTGKRINEAGPCTPVQVLGLNGAPQAGEKLKVYEEEKEAREIANKREQLLREQNIRTKKHITLDEIGRRLAIGNFKELNVIVKGDVDGSVEAISDSLLKLSTEEVQVKILHKGVGQISESDVLLASASDAIVIGFNVRPSGGARKLAESEEIEIRLYSVIYDAINEVKDAMEGMLAPSVEEVILGNVEVREVFKISRVGTVAGCYVTEGVIKRNSKARLIREGIVIHTGEIDTLKRFKDDVPEVKFGYECGIQLKNYNDVKVGDQIEPYEEKEVKRKLS